MISYSVSCLFSLLDFVDDIMWDFTVFPEIKTKNKNENLLHNYESLYQHFFAKCCCCSSIHLVWLEKKIINSEKAKCLFSNLILTISGFKKICNIFAIKKTELVFFFHFFSKQPLELIRCIVGTWKKKTFVRLRFQKTWPL